jgi:hypothetical protein
MTMKKNGKKDDQSSKGSVVDAHDVEYEEMYQHDCEQVSLSLEKAKEALHNARQTYRAIPPSHKLTVKIAEIKSICDSLLDEGVTEDANDAYRKGIVCIVGNTGFWHTGFTYYVAVGMANGRQVDLRCMPGFDAVQKNFDNATSFRYSDIWEKVGAENPAIKEALDLLVSRCELLWWDMVSAFLRDYIKKRNEQKHAESVLLKAGIPAHAVCELIGSKYPDFNNL